MVSRILLSAVVLFFAVTGAAFSDCVAAYRKLRARLGRATVPALVVWGEQDRLVSVAHGHAFVEGLPDARLVVVPGAGHYPYLEQPDAFAEAVAMFLRK